MNLATGVGGKIEKAQVLSAVDKYKYLFLFFPTPILMHFSFLFSRIVNFNNVTLTIHYILLAMRC